jgi:hypothetical protein
MYAAIERLSDAVDVLIQPRSAVKRSPRPCHLPAPSPTKWEGALNTTGHTDRPVGSYWLYAAGPVIEGSERKMPPSRLLFS